MFPAGRLKRNFLSPIAAAGPLLERALDLAPGEAAEFALEAAILLLDQAPFSDAR